MKYLDKIVLRHSLGAAEAFRRMQLFPGRMHAAYRTTSPAYLPLWNPGKHTGHFRLKTPKFGVLHGSITISERAVVFDVKVNFFALMQKHRIKADIEEQANDLLAGNKATPTTGAAQSTVTAPTAAVSPVTVTARTTVVAPTTVAVPTVAAVQIAPTAHDAPRQPIKSALEHAVDVAVVKAAADIQVVAAAKPASVAPTRTAIAFKPRSVITPAKPPPTMTPHMPVRRIVQEAPARTTPTVAVRPLVNLRKITAASPAPPPPTAVSITEDFQEMADDVVDRISNHLKKV